MIQSLPNPGFLTKLIACIRLAQRRIVVVNFLAQVSEKFNRKDKIEKVVRALIDAIKRGVKVEIVLEGSKFNFNYNFYRRLKDAGADCWMDTSQTFIHTKAILIDDKFLISGSHNLTDASMWASEEFSVLTDDARTIRIFKGELKGILKQKTEVRGRVCREGLYFDEAFVEKIVRPLYRAHAENAFKLYLMLMKEEGKPACRRGRQGKQGKQSKQGGGCSGIKIKESKWCEMLGIEPEPGRGKEIGEKYRRYYFKQRLNRFLYPLQDRYKLITIDRANDAVRRVPLEKLGKRVLLPNTFWKRGWRLSFAAKYFYLISLLETAESPFYPWWHLSMREIKKKYHCDHSIGKGADELARAGILEILEGVPIKRGTRYSEEANYYRLNPM